MHNGSLKRVFAASLAVTTAFLTFAGVFVMVPSAEAAVEAHPAGTLVLSGGTVWHISDDGTGRHGFDSAAKFYSHMFEWSDVVPANSADLALPDQGLMAWGNGALINDAGTVFQVSGGQKHGFTSAGNFTGNGFQFSNVVSASLAGVPAGANIDNTTAAHLEGTFVLSGGTVYQITATGKKGVTSPGVLFSYGVGFEDVVAANAADMAKATEGNLTFRTGALVNDGGTVWAVTGTTKKGFPTGSCFTGFGFSFGMLVSGSTSGLTASTSTYCAEVVTPPVNSTGTLTVSLASDTPATASAVKTAARVPFTKVNLTATGGDVTIDTMVLERTGVAVDSNFSSVILLDVSNGVSIGSANQIDNEKTLSSTHTASFTENITVKNGTTKSIMLAGNMAATLQAGDQPKLAVKSITLVGSASLVGTLPIVGNAMNMNNSVTIATATIAAGGSNPSATTQDVGTNDYIVSSIKITNSSVEKMEVHSIKFTQNGSAGDADVKDLELLVDGTPNLTVAAPTNKEVLFNFASPVIIDKGANKTFDVRLDIIDGSGRTISFDVDQQADVVVKGQTYGFFILPSYPNTTSPYFNASDTTIDEGALTFSKGTLSSLNVAEGTTGTVLGAFKTTVQGEPVQVTQFVIGVSVSGTGNAQDVSNLVVKDEDGVAVAGPVDPDTTVTTRDTATSTDTIIFPTGTHTYTIVGDLTNDFAASDSITLDLPDPDGLTTAKGTITNQTITAGPTSDLSLDVVTVQTGALSVSTLPTPAAQSVIVGATGFTFAQFLLDASAAGEDIRLTQMVIAHKTSANSIQTNIANLTLYDGTTALSPIVQPTAVADTTASSTFSLTNPITITKGSSKTLTLKGDLVTGSENQTHKFSCLGAACVTVLGVSTGSTITASVTNASGDGQLMTIAANGTMTLATDASNPNSAQYAGGSTGVTVGEMLIAANKENMNLSELHLVATAVNGGALNDEISKVYLYDGSTQIASLTPTTTAAITFTNLDGKFIVTAGASKKLTLKADFWNVTNNGGDGNIADSGDGISFSVEQDAYTLKGVSSGVKLAAGSMSGTFAGNEFTVFKSVPTWARVDLATADQTLSNGSGRPLYKFKLTADAKGDVGFYESSFLITTSTATVTQFQLIEEPGTGSEVDLTANSTRTISGIIGTASDGKNGQYSIIILMDTGTDGTTGGGEYRTIAAGTSKTYELRGTVASSVTGSSVSISMLGDLAQTAAPDQASDLDANYDFIWSDLFYGNSSSTATLTEEWFSGYRVAGMAATTSAYTVNR